MTSPSTQLNVLFEDNHLLVVDKPPLLPTMGVGEEEESLVTQSRSYLKEKYNKPGNVFLGVVSRLDAHVSGVVVLARTSKSASRLSEQFRERTVQKKYWALVPDDLPAAAGKLEDHVLKNESRHRMMVVPKDSPNAKLARLSYRTKGRLVRQKEPSLRWLEIELETGRKHQIRVQLEHAGCPIVGDRKYGSQLPFHRGIALHSRELVITHPTKKVLQSFKAETPSWWNTHQYALS